MDQRWQDEHPSKKSGEKTNKHLTFPVLQPDLQVTDGILIALINRGKLTQDWVSPNDFLIELQKSYPECEFDNRGVPTKVIFAGASLSRFEEDFYRHHHPERATAPPR